MRIEFIEEHPQGLFVPENCGWVASPLSLRGVVTDGMSGPWFIRWLFDRFDRRTIDAAVNHDDWYKRGNMLRFKADSQFRVKMLYNHHVLSWQNRSKSLRLWRKFNWRVRVEFAYYMLRAFGGVAWRKHRKNNSPSL